ncbi:hypothetical protein C1H76_4197 [Elsinoe australis]|uniref:Uncharacterized protein n=1 Tax=Elsinoe australis TaxID=40998 RepID=A0A4U7B2T2_9PEZI|nr:hypothetical protein C1H76_4197 [Elsinoe australis]
MARPNYSSSTSDHYHKSFPQSSAQPVGAWATGRGRSPSEAARPAMVHHERTSSTSVVRKSASSIHLQKRPSQASDEYDRTSVTARANYIAKKGLPPTPPRSSPSSPSPGRSHRSPPSSQDTAPAYKRCYTPPLDTKKKAAPLPGTMSSSQSKQNSPIKTRNRSGLGRRRTGSPAPTTKKVSQFLKNIFTKKEIDQDSFERIEDRHWTE